MTHLMCAFGLLVGAAGAHSSQIANNARNVAQVLKDARVPLEHAILAPQVSSVDLLLVALADEAIEEVQFAAPERWRRSEGKLALTESELAAVRARLGQIALAGHATPLGHFEVVLRPGEQLGLSTRESVKIARTTTSGDIDVQEVLVRLIPRLQLDQLDLTGQKLTLMVEMSVWSRTGAEMLATSTVCKEWLRVRSGDSLMMIVKNPLPIDARATENEGVETPVTAHRQRLLILTPGRESRPRKNGQIVRNLGVPNLAN